MLRYRGTCSNAYCWSRRPLAMVEEFYLQRTPFESIAARKPPGCKRKPLDTVKRPCSANPRDMIISAERRFPVRIRIGVPPGGFGQRYTEMTSWLDENCGADGWAITPFGVRGVLNGVLVTKSRRRRACLGYGRMGKYRRSGRGCIAHPEGVISDRGRDP